MVQFSNNPYFKKIEKPWGYEILWTPEGRNYVGKILHINAAARLSLQHHDQKEETWLLMKGRGKVIWDNADGELIETELEMGKGYSCVTGQRHRLVGITDCDILEASTPEKGTTFRLEDDYARPDETEAVRNSQQRGWNPS